MFTNVAETVVDFTDIFASSAMASLNWRALAKRSPAPWPAPWTRDVDSGRQLELGELDGGSDPRCRS